MAARSAVRHAPFFQRLHTVAIRPEVCFRKEVVAAMFIHRGLRPFFMRGSPGDGIGTCCCSDSAGASGTRGKSLSNSDFFSNRPRATPEKVVYNIHSAGGRAILATHFPPRPNYSEQCLADQGDLTVLDYPVLTAPLIHVTSLRTPRKKPSDMKHLRRQKFQFETLEPRHLLAADPILTEFVASNDSTINDGFGKDSDWIELYNAGDESINLQGYHLTDNAEDTTKWSFSQETILGAKEYLVVFASSNDTVDPAGYWHTNFNLSAGGEYVGLTDPSGTILSSFGDTEADYPPQVTDISYGLAGPTEQTLLSTSDQVDLLVPSNNSLGTSWTTVGFNAAANGFNSVLNAVGYETGSLSSSTSYQGFFNQPGAVELAGGTTTAYVRSEFNLDNANEVADLSLALTYDDGFAVYLNGSYLFGENEPASPLAYNSVAGGGRSDSQVLSQPVVFSLNDYIDLLQNGTNVLAIHALNTSNSSDMLLISELTARIGNVAGGPTGYLVEATPGAPNSQTFDLGPLIEDVEFTPSTASTNDPITVTASISSTVAPVDLASPKFYYRVNFESDIQASFADNGSGADATAGDGIFTAQIPASAFSEGDMVRWYISASDTRGITSRAPRFVDPLDSAEYFGTVILDPSASDDLPVLYWFVEDEAAAATRDGTRASIFYRGVFYDNIQVDLHGQSTAGLEFPKKAFDFDANKGEKFEIGDANGKHSDFNLLTNYADQSKLRNTVAYGSFSQAGGATHLAHSVSVHRNGDFYGLYDFVEEGDTEYLKRLGLDTDGALYKVNNALTSANDPNTIDKINRTYEGRDDFQEVVNARNLSGSTARTWYFDNLDIADIINYLAVQNAILNHDFGAKNMYWYRDSNNTQLWQVLPWDVDLSFGHYYNASGLGYFDNNLDTRNFIYAGWNNIFQNIINNSIDSRFKEMYHRRILSISDLLYGATGTPISQSWAYQQFEFWDGLTADEAAQDLAKWGLHPNFTHTPAQAVDQIQGGFLATKRQQINGVVGAQSGVQDIEFGAIEFAPSSGNQDEEYIVLTNNNQSFATDLSGWTISGAINHTFKSGTVIPAGETLYVLADVQGFQARTTGPRGGQQLFTQGNYAGRLFNGGGSLVLANATGTQIDTATFVGDINNGDFDDDGDFDGADFLAWQRGFGIANGANPSDGDADEDGKVDGQDLELWASHYGSPATVSAMVMEDLAENLPAGEAASSSSLAALASWSIFHAELPQATTHHEPAHDAALTETPVANAILNRQASDAVSSPTVESELADSDKSALEWVDLFDEALEDWV